jgi:hypothetical protein
LVPDYHLVAHVGPQSVHGMVGMLFWTLTLFDIIVNVAIFLHSAGLSLEPVIIINMQKLSLSSLIISNWCCWLTASSVGIHCVFLLSFLLSRIEMILHGFLLPSVLNETLHFLVSTTFIKFVNVGEQHPAVLESLQLIHPLFPPSFNVLVYTHVNVCVFTRTPFILSCLACSTSSLRSSDGSLGNAWCLAVFPELQGRKNLPYFLFVSLAFRFNISEAVV